MLSWLVTIGGKLEPYWAIILIIAVPIAAVAGFLSNIASLKKTRFENKRLAEELSRVPKTLEKLELEIAALRRAQMDAEEKRLKEGRLVQPADAVEMRQLVSLRDAFEREQQGRIVYRQEMDFPPSNSQASARSYLTLRWMLRVIFIAFAVVGVYAVSKAWLGSNY